MKTQKFEKCAKLLIQKEVVCFLAKRIFSESLIRRASRNFKQHIIFLFYINQSREK